MEQITTNEYRLICFTAAGRTTMKAVGDGLMAPPNSIKPVSSLPEWTKTNFKKGNCLIFVGAAGIAVRAIAPFVKDKSTDPAVIVIDEAGSFVIPILSGHLGGANEAAYRISKLIEAVPVITTATDIRGEFAVDVFAKNHDLYINDMKLAKEFSAKLLAGEKAVFCVSPKVSCEDSLTLVPRCIVAGMGARKGKSFEELRDFLLEALGANDFDTKALRALVSIDIKSKEPGLVRLAEYFEIPFITFSAGALMAVEGDFESSELALKVTGADNVCERSLAAYGCDSIIQKKLSKAGMTLALGIKV